MVVCYNEISVRCSSLTFPSLPFPTWTESLDISSCHALFRMHFPLEPVGMKNRQDSIGPLYVMSFFSLMGRGGFIKKEAFTKPNPPVDASILNYSVCTTASCKMTLIHKCQEYHNTPCSFFGQIWEWAAGLCLHILSPRGWELSRANPRGLSKECFGDREVLLCRKSIHQHQKKKKFS